MSGYRASAMESWKLVSDRMEHVVGSRGLCVGLVGVLAGSLDEYIADCGCSGGNKAGEEGPLDELSEAREGATRASERENSMACHTVSTLISIPKVQECLYRVREKPRARVERDTPGFEQLAGILCARLHDWNSFGHFWNHRLPTLKRSDLGSVKLPSAYQSAATLAQDVAMHPRSPTRPFRSLSTRIPRAIASAAPFRLKWLLVRCAGREWEPLARKAALRLAMAARPRANTTIDYAAVSVATRCGMLGVKVWISFQNTSDSAFGMRTSYPSCPRLFRKHIPT